MSSCVSGCCLRGEHLAECDGTAVDRAGEVVECRGCLPRAAEAGCLCSWCWGRLQSAVRTLPALVDHLWDAAVPSVSSPSGRTGAGRSSRPGEGMLYPAALVEVDELQAVLATWCDEVAEECPDASGVTLEGLTRWTVWDHEAVGPRSAGATRRLVRWLDPHLGWCARQPWVGDMLGDLATACSRARARFPIEECERRVDTVRCPACGAWSLVVVPPAVYGADAVVRCVLPACGLVMSEEDWARTRERAVVVARCETGSGVGE